MTTSIRLGAAAFATIELLIGLVFTIIGGFAANALDSVLGDMRRLSLLLYVFTSVVLVVFSIIGLYGVWKSKRKPVSLYWAAMFAHIFVSIASGGWLLYYLFQPGTPEDDNKCASLQIPFAQDACHRTQAMKGATVTGLILTWLIEIAGLFIVNSYSSKLTTEEIKQAEKEAYGDDW